MVEAMRRHLGLGLVAMLASSAAFGTSGPVAKSLMTAGWSPGAVVLARITGAALILLPFALWSLRGQWRAIRRELPRVALYGTLAVAAAQLGYFQAVSRMDVGIALLIEYLGIVLVVLWVWALTHQRPHRLTVVGIVLALFGLALVLAARPTAIPSTAFAGLGLTIGAIALAVLGLVGVLPMDVGDSTVQVAGAGIPAWLALAALVVVAAAFAFALGIVGARLLGSTLASRSPVGDGASPLLLRPRN